MEVLTIVAPVFGVLLLGLVLRAVGFLGDGEVGALVKVVYYLGLPAIIFVAITSTELSEVVDGSSLLGMAVAITSFSVLFFLAVRPLTSSVSRRAVATVVVMRGNMAFVGLPIVYSAWGDLGLAKAGVIIGVLTPPTAVATVVLFRTASAAGGATFRSALRALADPIVVASLGGLAASWAEWSPPGPLGDGLDMLAGMALPAALLAIGASFTRKSLTGNIVLTGFAAFAKLALLPLWGLVLLSTVFGVPSDSLDLEVAVLLLTTPSAVANYVMSRELVPRESGVVGMSVALTTALAVPTMTLWLAFLL